MRPHRYGILGQEVKSAIRKHIEGLSEDEKLKLLKQQQEVIEWLRDNFVKKEDNGKRRNDNKESDMDG